MKKLSVIVFQSYQIKDSQQIQLFSTDMYSSADISGGSKSMIVDWRRETVYNQKEGNQIMTEVKRESLNLKNVKVNNVSTVINKMKQNSNERKILSKNIC